MEKKKYCKPKSIYLPINVGTSLLNDSPGGGLGSIETGEVDGDGEEAKQFSFGFDSNEE